MYNQELKKFKAEIFQALAHPTRIAMVEVLGDQEKSAGQLIEELGLEQANASQHLAVLRGKQVVLSRKVGNQVFYRVRDPVLLEVLGLLKEYFDAHIAHSTVVLKKMKRAELSRK